jgi:hypothetical protein
MNSHLPLPPALPAASTSSAWHAEQPVYERDLTFSWRAVSHLYQHFPASISPFVHRTIALLMRERSILPTRSPVALHS